MAETEALVEPAGGVVGLGDARVRPMQVLARERREQGRVEQRADAAAGGPGAQYTLTSTEVA